MEIEFIVLSKASKSWESARFLSDSTIMFTLPGFFITSRLMYWRPLTRRSSVRSIRLLSNADFNLDIIGGSLSCTANFTASRESGESGGDVLSELLEVVMSVGDIEESGVCVTEASELSTDNRWSSSSELSSGDVPETGSVEVEEFQVWEVGFTV